MNKIDFIDLNKSALLKIEKDDGNKVEVNLNSDDIDSLRFKLENFYRNKSEKVRESQINILSGKKITKQDFNDNSKVVISAKLYKEFQHLVQEKKHLNFELMRRNKLIHNLRVQNHALYKSIHKDK